MDKLDDLMLELDSSKILDYGNFRIILENLPKELEDALLPVIKDIVDTWNSLKELPILKPKKKI